MLKKFNFLICSRCYNDSTTTQQEIDSVKVQSKSKEGFLCYLKKAMTSRGGGGKRPYYTVSSSNAGASNEPDPLPQGIGSTHRQNSRTGSRSGSRTGSPRTAPRTGSGTGSGTGSVRTPAARTQAQIAKTQAARIQKQVARGHGIYENDSSPSPARQHRPETRSAPQGNARPHPATPRPVSLVAPIHIHRNSSSLSSQVDTSRESIREKSKPSRIPSQDDAQRAGTVTRARQSNVEGARQSNPSLGSGLPTPLVNNTGHQRSRSLPRRQCRRHTQRRRSLDGERKVNQKMPHQDVTIATGDGHIYENTPVTVKDNGGESMTYENLMELTSRNHTFAKTFEPGDVTANRKLERRVNRVRIRVSTQSLVDPESNRNSTADAGSTQSMTSLTPTLTAAPDGDVPRVRASERVGPGSRDGCEEPRAVWVERSEECLVATRTPSFTLRPHGDHTRRPHTISSGVMINGDPPRRESGHHPVAECALNRSPTRSSTSVLSNSISQTINNDHPATQTLRPISYSQSSHTNLEQRHNPPVSALNVYRDKSPSIGSTKSTSDIPLKRLHAGNSHPELRTSKRCVSWHKDVTSSDTESDTDTSSSGNLVIQNNVPVIDSRRKPITTDSLKELLNEKDAYLYMDILKGGMYNECLENEQEPEEHAEAVSHSSRISRRYLHQKLLDANFNVAEVELSFDELDDSRSEEASVHFNNNDARSDDKQTQQQPAMVTMDTVVDKEMDTLLRKDLGDLFLHRNQLSTGRLVFKDHISCMCEGTLRMPEEGTTCAKPVTTQIIRGLNCNEDRACVLRNIRALRGLRHEHVVHMFGVCAEGSPHTPAGCELLVAMERLHYLVNLRRLLCWAAENNSKLLTVQVAVTFGVQLMDALTYLDEQGLIHATLNSFNTLLARQCALRVSGVEAYSGGPFTPPHEWLSLEQLRGEAATGMSVIWSVGVVLWELMAGGTAPFDEAVGSQDLTSRLNRGQRLARPNACPRTLYAVLLRTWHPKPEERPSLAQLSKTLTALKNSAPAVSLPDTFPDREDFWDVFRDHI